MRIDTGQHIRIDQRMKLAPRMIQSMEILQMPMAALEERIDQELASNPTLELAEPGAQDIDLAAEHDASEREATERERELTTSDSATEDFERLDNLTEQYGEAMEGNLGASDFHGEAGDDFARRRVRSAAGERDGKLDAMNNAAARGASLFDQLADQWRLVEVPPPFDEAGLAFIGLIDADGYLRADDTALREVAPHGMSEDQRNETIELLQISLDPPGLAARDLKECLLLQIDSVLDAEPGDHPTLLASRQLVAHHLHNIEANRYPVIAKATGLDIDQVKAAVHALRRFTPHPGRLLASEDTRTITPDAVIEYDEPTDTYTATLTAGHLPALQISPDYQDLAKDKQTDKHTRDFVNHQLRSASWLLDAINQRRNTLLRVIGVVVQAQRDFFDTGPQALKPLPMTGVADQLGIHVATVSRAVSEKYLQTPRGIFPLRMFFSGGTETDSGESVSWAAIQAKLREIIDSENKDKPLSDDVLVEELKKHGIELARRTVAKYRKEMNIPTARQRREY